MINFEELNKNIEYLLTKEDIYYVKMFNLFDEIANDYLLLLQNYIDILDINEDFEENLSYTEILKQVCLFYKKNNPQYYNLLKIAYKKKFINIDIKNQDEAYCDLKKGHGFINWPLTFSIDDSFCLVHEFSHYLNLNQKVSLAREYLTEALSILNEFLLHDYLEQKNYSNKEYMKVKILKFVLGYDNAYSLYKNSDIIDIYLKYGKIDENNIYNYYNNSNLRNELEFKCSIYSEGELPFFQNKKYLFGVVLACDMHQQLLNNHDYINKIIYLMNNINDLQLKDCFNILNINFTFNKGNFFIERNHYKRIMDNFEFEFKDTYSKYKGLTK